MGPIPWTTARSPGLTGGDVPHEVEGVAEGLHDSGLLEGHPVWYPVQQLVRDGHVLGESAVRVDAEERGALAEVAHTLKTETAGAAGLHRLAEDTIAHGEPLYPWTYLSDLSRELVPHDDGQLHLRVGRRVIVDPEVTPADSGSPDLDQHLAYANLGDGQVDDLDTRLRPALNDSLQGNPSDLFSLTGALTLFRGTPTCNMESTLETTP